MGSGFFRRYGYFPGTAVITQIEGIIAVDLPAPGSIAGVASGVVCCVGEFQDSTYGVTVDVNGNFTRYAQPTEIFSAQDMLNKVGGFDELIGDFGGTMGNGFIELRNKVYSRLIVLPISLASAKGVRSFRKLPFNVSATSPISVVPMQAAQVNAGTPFLNGSNRIRLAGPVRFTGGLPYASGTDGSVQASSGATETFIAQSLNNTTLGTVAGDALVLGAPLSTAILQDTVGASAAALSLASPGWTGYPTSGLLQIDGEYITYSGVTSGPTAAAFTGLGRAAQSSIGATHAAGAIAVGLNNVDTYRVRAVPGTTSLTLERQDGSSFTSGTNSFSASGMAWRLHAATDADSSAGANSAAGAYKIPARPIDAAIAAATAITPAVPPTAITYNSWDPLSGLGALTDPSTGLAYTAAIQGANPISSPTLDAVYVNALVNLLGEGDPERSVNIVWAARKSANIRTGLKTHVLQASGVGIGRTACLAPDLSVLSTSAASSSTDPGVGGNRDERVFYSWPPVRTFIPEAVGFNLKGSDGLNHSDGSMDVTGDGWLASVLSNLNPELNPGQAAPPVPAVLSPLTGFARGIPKLNINDYTVMRQSGICGLRFDRSVGPVFQSGVTTSLTSGQTTIQRRRFADFWEDSIADAIGPLAKLPMTHSLQDSIVTQIDAFGASLLSEDNPAAQRINAYLVDAVSGNTPEMQALGIFVIITKVRTTPTADFIVFQSQVGNNVVITEQVT